MFHTKKLRKPVKRPKIKSRKTDITNVISSLTLRRMRPVSSCPFLLSFTIFLALKEEVGILCHDHLISNPTAISETDVMNGLHT